MSEQLKPCPHDLAEKELACANGSCPICPRTHSERDLLVDKVVEAAGTYNEREIHESLFDLKAHDAQAKTKEK